MRQFSYFSIFTIILSLSCSISEKDQSYFDLKPPGQNPEVFAPDIVSTELSAHSYPAFSPDGKDVFWSAYSGRFTNQKIYIENEKGKTIERLN